MFQQIGDLYVSLPSGREIAMSRVINAPRRLVFDAFTKPDLVRCWLAGPPGWEFAVCDIDLSVGGSYRYVWKREIDQAESTMSGKFRIIVPERLVASEMTDETLGVGRIFDTAVLVERGATTVLKLAILYEAQAARDIVLESDILSGMAAGYDRLDAFLASSGPFAC